MTPFENFLSLISEWVGKWVGDSGDQLLELDFPFVSLIQDLIDVVGGWFGK